MKRRALSAVVLSTVVLAACGQGELTVRAELKVPDSSTPEAGDSVVSALEDLEVWLLPYDRDVIFDSLEAGADVPEPQIPDSLLQLQDDVAAAQREWRRLEDRWNGLRDRLKQLRSEMDQYNRGEARYRELFQEFNALDGQLQDVEDAKDEAFQEFTTIQKRFLEQSEEIRLQREQWAADAFQDVGAVIEARLEELGRTEHVDTTGAEGTARFNVKPGTWWVHARHELPYSELYWNAEIRLEGGEPRELILNRESAETRPNL